MHSFELRDFGPAQDGQTVALEAFSGVVSPRGRRVEGVVVGTANPAVRGCACGVARGMDGEDGREDWLLGFMIVCEDMIPDLELTHGEYTSAGANGGVKRKTAFSSDAAPNAGSNVAAPRAVDAPLLGALVVGV